MNYKNLTIADYDSQFFTPKTEHFLLDVRSAYEYANVRMPAAVNIPLEELQSHLAEVPQDRPIIVVCASGNRSRFGSQILTQANYTDVYNLQGGTMTWMLGMRPVERS